MSTYNAQETAQSQVYEAVGNLNNLRDFDRDSIQEAAGEYLEGVMYYSEMEQVINDYEANHWRDAEDLTSGLEFKAGDWQQAQSSYANTLWYCAVTSEINEAVANLEDQIQLFKDEVETLGGDPEDARFANDCAYGWEAHNYETNEGVMVWGAKNPHGEFNYNPSLLEGELVAVSFKLGNGLWLNMAWTPGQEEQGD
jgi:hypothetical protein